MGLCILVSYHSSTLASDRSGKFVYLSLPLNKVASELQRLKDLPLYKESIVRISAMVDLIDSLPSQNRSRSSPQSLKRLDYLKRLFPLVRQRKDWSGTLREEVYRSVESEIERLEKNSEEAERLLKSQFILHLKEETNAKEFVRQLIVLGFDAEEESYLKPTSIPTDKMLADQWSMGNDFGINAIEYWSQPRSSLASNTGVAVAVLDSGIVHNHSDFWNLTRTKTSILPGLNILAEEDGLLPEDTSPYHGTRVSGVIAALANNDPVFCKEDHSCTMAGVIGRDENVSLLPIRIYKGTTISKLDLIRGIYLAVNEGSWVINISSGSSGFYRPLKNALRYAWLHDVIVVTSAGNSFRNSDIILHYPSSYNLPNIISVGAIGAAGFVRAFSNVGECTVDLFAPGGDVITTAGEDNDYVVASGTSMSAPFVSAGVGILRSHFPSLSSEQIIYSVRAGVTPDSRYIGTSLTEGRFQPHTRS